MGGKAKRNIVLGAAAALAVAGGGAAVAATQLGSPREESQAILNDAARQLGIEPSKLSDALKQALKNRVDAAVAAGRLTKEQGEAFKTRIDADEYPFLFGGPGGFGHPGHFGHFAHFAHFGDVSVAASYLEVTADQLHTDLRAGKTLAQIAKDKGKPVDGLIKVLVDKAKERLDAAVKAGRLTEDQKQSILADLEQKVTDFVNGIRPAFGRHHLRGPDSFFGDRFGGPRPHMERGDFARPRFS
jgi:polyhydroxyalkanoate synthesis regulator phasin